VFAAGKAAATMAAALAADSQLISSRIVAVGTHRPDDLPTRVIWHEGSHPLPDERSVAAGRAALAMARSVATDEMLVLLLSGGASALAAVPADGISLADKRQTIERMMHAGADIHALNTVRKHLSALKGGALARDCRGLTLTLAVSDVIGDDLSVIGSGPGVADPSSFAEAAAALLRFGGESHPAAVKARLRAGADGRIRETPKPGSSDVSRADGRVIATRRDALAAAAAEAEAQGYRAVIIPDAVTGEARTAASHWLDTASRLVQADDGPVCVVSAGETTVRVTGTGRGGRNQEFVLALVRQLAACAREIAVASIGTDGIDGPTDAAGAVVDRSTLARAEAIGAIPEAALADNDSFSFFEALGDLVRTGRTDTNVGDLQVLIADPRPWQP
jgi:glycerate 2-kinase